MINIHDIVKTDSNTWLYCVMVLKKNHHTSECHLHCGWPQQRSFGVQRASAEDVDFWINASYVTSHMRSYEVERWRNKRKFANSDSKADKVVFFCFFSIVQFLMGFWVETSSVDTLTNLTWFFSFCSFLWVLISLHLISFYTLLSFQMHSGESAATFQSAWKQKT